MKITLIIALLFCVVKSNAQEITPELRQKLTGKTKFEDIKTTINKHYEGKLNTLKFKDSLQRKAIMRQLKKWNRQFWLSEYYTNADGKVQDKNKIDAEAYRNFQNNNNASTNTASRQNVNWINQGPYYSNTGIGRMDKIAFHPTNPNIIYAGSPHGGLFKTTDGGDNWYNTSPNLPSLGIAGIAIDPSNPQVVYVLTGDANSSDGSLVNTYQYRANSSGVYKSYDGGISWEISGFLAPTFVTYRGNDLIINPSNPNILIAATSNGIYRTTNGGQVWDYVFAEQIFDLEFKPNNPNIVYAANNRFLKSTDGGASFNYVAIANISTANRIAIGVTPANPNRVVLIAGKVSTILIANLPITTFTGIFTSPDAGDNFTRLTQTPIVFYNGIGDAVNNDQSNYDICIAISPTNQNDIYVGGLCVWHSTNGGSNWAQVSAYWPSDNPYMHPDIHELKINPLNNNLFCGNDGGVYRYNGAGWDQKYRGQTATQFYHFERENDDEKIWGGAQDNGIIQQTNGGDYETYIFGDGYDMMTDNEYLVSNGEADDVYFTLNESIKKDLAGTIIDINVPDNDQFFGNLAMSPLLEDKIYVGYQNGVYRSLNAGSNWNSIGGSGNWCISSCRNDDFRLYAAGSGAGADRLFRYNLSAFAIDPITPPAPYTNNLKITDIDVDPVNSNNIWISVGGTQADAKVFYSDDAGATWENYTFNLPNVPIFCIKKDASYGLYVGTSIGVFYCKNVNSFWEPFSNGLPPTPVTEIELWPEPNPVNNFVPWYSPFADPEIYISTFGRGIWYTKQSSSICPPNIGLTGNVSGVMLSEAGNSILSNQQLTGGVGTNVKYNASQSILLTDGFFAPEGTRFQTYTTGCGTQIDLNRMKHLKME